MKPAARDTGVIFVRTDKPMVIKAYVGSVIDTAFATTIGHNGVKIRTIEHLMAALAGMGIDNIYIEVSGPEIPILDGSSTELISIILNAGIAKQGKKRPYLRIKRPFAFEDGHSKIVAFPYKASDPRTVTCKPSSGRNFSPRTWSRKQTQRICDRASLSVK